MGERLEEKSNQDLIQKIAKDDQLDHKHAQVKEKIAEDFSASQKEGIASWLKFFPETKQLYLKWKRFSSN